MAVRRFAPLNSPMTEAAKAEDVTISGDWTYTGVLDFSGATVSGLPYLPLSGGTLTGALTFSGNSGTLGDNTTSTYSPLITTGSKGGYGGISLDGNFTLMNSGAAHVGLYNDVNDEWMMLAYPNDRIQLYFNGSEKLRTTSTGVDITGGATLDSTIEVDYGIAGDNKVLHGQRGGDWIQLGNDGGGLAMAIGSAYQTSAAGNDYRAYWAYDCYWNEDTNKWVALRTTLGRKWKAEMGYHANTFEIAQYDGTVSSPWNDTSWNKRLTVTNTYLEQANTYGYVQMGPVNGSYCHFITDISKFYFNKPVHIAGQPFYYNLGAIYYNGSSSYASGKVTFSTSAASGGSSGDIWYQYT